MKYAEFKNKVLELPLFSKNDIMLFAGDTQNVRNQITRWQDSGLILKLRKGIYVLNTNDRKITPSRHYIANQLYTPSYISMEYALSYYGLIPERVCEIISIAAKKTASFENGFGRFVYQHVKPDAFRGYRSVLDENKLTTFIAEPEKAVVDFLYLNKRKIKVTDADIFENSYRFQNVEKLSTRKLLKLAELFKSPKLDKIVKLFCGFIKKEKS